MTRIIVLTSGKGGVGKSSISVNVGYALSKQGKKVCLVDADFGLKNLDVMMGLENRVLFDLKDVISGKCSLKQILVKDKRLPSLFLLPACKSLSFENLNIDYMLKMIDQLKREFDYILIDSPAGVEKGFQYASRLGDEAIIVVTLDIVSIRDADRVIGLLLKQGIHNLHMIVNKYNEDNVQKGRCLSIQDAHDILSIPILGIVYDDYQMIDANNKGVPISSSENTFLSQCFTRIAKRLEGEDVPFPKNRKKPLFERIFR